jgi:hypothetical protein
VLLEPVADALARAALDAPELLDVDVDQLAGPLALVALRGLAPQPAELAHPDPGQDARHRRQRSIEDLGDFRSGEPQPSQRRDRFDSPLVGAIGDHGRRRGTIQQTARALRPEPLDPLRARAVADSGGLGRLRQRPPELDHPRHHPLALSQ